MCLEDTLNNVLIKIQNTDKQSSGLIKKSVKLKEKIKTLFLETQNRIFTSFFDNLFKYSSIANFRKAIFNYRKLIGVTDDYTFFNEYYINKMVALEERFSNSANKHLALVPIKNTLLSRALRKIKLLVEAAEAHIADNAIIK